MKVKVSYLYRVFLQICHRIKGALQYTVSFLYEEEPPPLRSTPWWGGGTYRTRAGISWVSQSVQPIRIVHFPPIAIIYQALILPTHGGMEG